MLGVSKDRVHPAALSRKKLIQVWRCLKVQERGWRNSHSRMASGAPLGLAPEDEACCVAQSRGLAGCLRLPLEH